jgi:hypothetical protein
MGDLISLIIDAVVYSIAEVIWPISKVLIYFMGFVLILTFIGNISGILGFFLFMLMFYYYIKGIIFIEPSS